MFIPPGLIHRILISLQYWNDPIGRDKYWEQYERDTERFAERHGEYVLGFSAVLILLIFGSALREPGFFAALAFILGIMLFYDRITRKWAFFISLMMGILSPIIATSYSGLLGFVWGCISFLYLLKAYQRRLSLMAGLMAGVASLVMLFRDAHVIFLDNHKMRVSEDAFLCFFFGYISFLCLASAWYEKSTPFDEKEGKTNSDERIS